jgi:magnesium-transporting ATPase (P-type)
MISTNEAVHLTVSEVLERLQTDAGLGLTEAEVAARQRQHPPNELEAEDPEPLYKKFFDTFKDPLILLLLGSCLVSCVLSIIAAHYYVYRVSIYSAITALGNAASANNMILCSLLRTSQNLCCLSTVCWSQRTLAYDSVIDV